MTCMDMLLLPCCTRATVERGDASSPVRPQHGAAADPKLEQRLYSKPRWTEQLLSNQDLVPSSPGLIEAVWELRQQRSCFLQPNLKRLTTLQFEFSVFFIPVSIIPTCWVFFKIWRLFTFRFNLHRKNWSFKKLKYPCFQQNCLIFWLAWKIRSGKSFNIKIILVWDNISQWLEMFLIQVGILGICLTPLTDFFSCLFKENLPFRFFD